MYFNVFFILMTNMTLNEFWLQLFLASFHQNFFKIDNGSGVHLSDLKHPFLDTPTVSKQGVYS